MRESKAILAVNLERIIAERGLKKGDVAARAGFKSQSELTPYLKGDRAASLDIVDRLAAALDTSPAKLLDDGTAPESGAPPVTEAAVKAWVKLGEEIGMFPPDMSEKYETALADLRKLAAGQYVPPRSDAPESPGSRKPRARRQ